MDYFLKDEYITDDTLGTPWFNLDNWITAKEYAKLDSKTKQYYVKVK